MKQRASIITFALVFLLAMVPPDNLLYIYSITVTVACPLIATVLPGFFSYINIKVNFDPEKNTKCQ